MLLFFKRLVLVAAVALLAREPRAFSLLGAFNDWQVPGIGYDPQNDGGDLGGPKNLGEEYRWTTPDIYYAFDTSFIDWFGINGIAEIEKAVQIFNNNTVRLGDLTDAQMAARFGYDRARQRFNMPVGRGVNMRAAALGVLDLKSYAMGMLAEQLGLASAERWTYALRARAVVQNITNYVVIYRNFDPFTFTPSSYVNGERYSYRLLEFADPPANFADAVEIRVNQSPSDPVPYAVANIVGEDFGTGYDLAAGEFFGNLTMDDLAGLRYIYRRQNINEEDVIPGTSFIFTDPNTFTFVQGFDAFTFYSNATVLSPAQMLAAYTNLVILQTNAFIQTVFTTNRVTTNLFSADTLFTNRAQLTLLSNLDYGTFVEAARTNNPNQMRALYPGLVITSTNSGVTTQIVENIVLTNFPWGVPGEIGFAITNYTTNLVPTFRYTFGNLIVRYASAVSDWLVEDIGRAPWGVPGEIILSTNRVAVRTNRTSGGFLILDRTTAPNLVNYSFVDEQGNPLLKTTNIIETTNLVTSLINPFTGDVRIRNIVTRFTNVVEAAYPVFANTITGQQDIDVVTPSLEVRYNYQFGNVQLFPSPDQTITVRERTVVPPNPIEQLTITRIPSPFPIGSVVIIDPEQFALTNFRITNSGLATNLLISFTNATTGAYFVREVVYQTNSVLIAANPVIIQAASGNALRPGVDTLTFRPFPARGNFYQLTNVIATNFYDGFTFTNGQAFPQRFRRVGGPDIIFSGGDGGVSGDPVPFAVFRTINWNPDPAPTFFPRPGVILPTSTITFSRLLLSELNSWPGDWTTGFPVSTWGSFDGDPDRLIIYPQDVTLQDLENLVLRRRP